MTFLLTTTKSSDKRTNFLINDLNKIFDCKVEFKVSDRKSLSDVYDYMYLNDCNTAIFFEITKKTNYIWFISGKNAIKCNLETFTTIFELATLFNGHKEAGYEIYFGKDFDECSFLKDLKNVLKDVFLSKKKLSLTGEKKYNKERIISFLTNDDIIYFRHYLVDNVSEIGPRIEFSIEKVIEYDKNTKLEE
ncbi:BRX1 [Hepatospora eriocheir]|uniref:BRX1 n=1 Tax=Hepatospora eriocheir TaxID=1081669 RepID=A0A1X0QFE7_9MICR|nr:BRX1 [Hepatospora eriocheir]